MSLNLAKNYRLFCRRRCFDHLLHATCVGFNPKEISDTIEQCLSAAFISGAMVE